MSKRMLHLVAFALSFIGLAALLAATAIELVAFFQEHT